MSGVQWAGVAAGVLTLGGLAWWLFRVDSEEEGLSEDPANPDSPMGLALASGHSLAAYCLARAIASEAGGSNYRAQLAVGWTIQNYADRHFGGDVVRAVLGSADGFGSQGSGGRGYVSTKRAPLQSQLELAENIIAERVADPTGGATNFDSPREQLREYNAGQVTRTPEQVASDRVRSGLVAYDVDVAGADFRFWGPA